MIEDTNNRRHIVLGILAHVDAGKTTLSESLLYLSGAIRRQGRVDHGDAFLDTDSMEKQRGITIFSKQAELHLDQIHAEKSSSVSSHDFPGVLDITLLDTPGHADFSPEMERTLSVLDYAVLVISAPDGITGQVRNLWHLLSHYQIPVFLFVNKMDQPGMDTDELTKKISSEFGNCCIRIPDTDPSDFDEKTIESLAVCDDSLLERYLDEGSGPSRSEIAELIASRKMFPLFFGSALKNKGVDALANALFRFTVQPLWPDSFCAKVFKISRDDSGTRLAWLRILGGTLRARSEVRLYGNTPSDTPDDQAVCKIDQIRQYSGESFTTLREAPAGQIVCVTGLGRVSAGQMLADPAHSGSGSLSETRGTAAQTRPSPGSENHVLKRAQSPAQSPENSDSTAR